LTESDQAKPTSLEPPRNYSVRGSVESHPDEFTLLEEQHQKVVSFRLENERERSDQKDRKIYSERVFLLAINWIVVVIAILLIDGCVQMGGFFEISDSVMITLIGATTATVLGLFAFVMKYLFYRP
jgi:membrane glycosyltransferase